jgi:hypothetical protein
LDEGFLGVISGSIFLRQNTLRRAGGGTAAAWPAVFNMDRLFIAVIFPCGAAVVLFQFRYEAEIFTNIVCHFTKNSLNLRLI